jgi:hypothetical protein
MFDGDLVNQNEDNSGSCHVAISFRASYVAILDKIRFFLPVTQATSTYEGKLKFQGSNDASSWTDIYQADGNVHSGWNYVQWDSSDSTVTQPKYRHYRFEGTGAGACLINEAELHGVETIDDSSSTYACTPRLVLGGVSHDLSGAVTYTGSSTPVLTSISPRYGRVEGGDSVTFTGTDFSATASDYTILLDGVACSVTSASTTAVTCTTGARTGLRNSTLVMEISGKGYVSTQGKVFTYVNLWSSDVTWGGEFAPLEGESVYVPSGLNLLVDADSTPVLNAVIVEGSIIFAPDTDPTHHRTFDAHYIFVNEGKMEVGTEEFPYTSRITITMHSDVSDPYLPIYGNKVIGVRYGTLDMHGPTRTPTWTELETTSEAGSNTITLKEAVDWVAGEEIAIAPTDFEARHAERRTIVSIDDSNPSKPIITLDAALEYKHFAQTQTFGADTIDMRAEVGLLTRNVVYRGDPETSSDNQYGATIFLHSNGDDSLTARLGYCEFTDMG